MSDSLQISFLFTEAALKNLQPGEVRYSLSLSEEMPIPVKGDVIEVAINGSLHLFLVKRRTIGWHSYNSTIQLLLDVPE